MTSKSTMYRGDCECMSDDDDDHDHDGQYSNFRLIVSSSSVILKDIHRYHLYPYLLPLFLFKFFRLGLLPAHLIDKILESQLITFPLLKLIANEKWRISSITLQDQILDVFWFKCLTSCKETLRKVRLLRCSVDKNAQKSGIKFLCELYNMHCLEILGCMNMSLKHLMLIKSKLRELKSLKIEHLSQGMFGLNNIFQEDVPGLPALKDLTLMDINIDAKSFINLLKALESNLETLDIRGLFTSSKDVDYFQTVFTGCLDRVHTINLANNPIGPRFVLSLMSWFPTLRQLTVSVGLNRTNFPTWNVEFPEDAVDPLLLMALDQLEASGISITRIIE